jgi:hypothetical protein
MAVLIGGPTILALASGRREGGETANGRHFEILLNLTFGRAPPSEGLPSKRRIWWPCSCHLQIAGGVTIIAGHSQSPLNERGWRPAKAGRSLASFLEVG